MDDFIAALGLMLVIEGAMYALFTDTMRRMMAQALLLPTAQIRIVGLVLAGLGFAVVAAVRGLPSP